MDPTLTGAGASSPSRGVHPRRALRDLFTDLDSRGIHATPRAVAVALWSHANANGGAWPSQRRLARMTGRCVRTVGSAVRELEAAGVIVRQVPELRLRRARHATTVYRLLAGDAPPFVPSVPPLVEPPADLVAAVGRVAALVARDHEPMDSEAVDQSPADPEPPLVEFLPGLLVAVAVDACELVDTETAEPPLVDAVDLDGVPPADAPELVDTEAAPITGNPCRTRETSNLRTADLFARDQRPDAPVGRPPRRRPPPPPTPRRGCPVRAFVVPPVVSTLSDPSVGVVGAPARSPPPALAAAAARCAALTRRR